MHEIAISIQWYWSAQWGGAIAYMAQVAAKSAISWSAIKEARVAAIKQA
jgi:hypothetical protein